MSTLINPVPEVDKLFRLTEEERLDRCIERVKRICNPPPPSRLETCLDRIGAALKAMEPLSPAAQRAICKRYQRPEDGGTVSASEERGHLAYTPDKPSFRGLDERVGSVFAICSTATEDRVGDIIRPEGIDLTAYRKNPTVLFSHKAEDLPIGTTRDPQSGECTARYDPHFQALTARIFLAQDNELARQVWSLIKQKALSGISIGFNPLSDPRPLPSGGSLFDAVELLEISITAVPCNRETLVIAEEVLESGQVEGKALHPSIRKALATATRHAKRF